MPRNITVKFEDGSTHTYKNAPDNVTPEQVSQRAAQEFGKSVMHLDGGKKAETGIMADLKQMGGDVMDEVSNIGTGLAKGFMGLATLAGDAMAHDPQTRLAVQAAGGKQPQVGDVSRMVGQMGYQPKTTGQRYRQSTAAGVGGALFPGPGVVSAPVKQMAIGGSAGLGSEVGSQLSDGNPLGGLVGGLLGGLGTGIGLNMRGNTPQLARETLHNVDPKDLAAAQAAMRAAEGQGIPINLSQAMPKPSNIDTMVSALANSRYGKRVTDQLNKQPEQVAFGMENQMLGLPGTIRAPQIVANNAQEVATQVIDGAKKQRTTAWEQTLAAGQKRLKDGAAAGVAAAKGKVDQMRGRLTQAQAVEAAKRQPPKQTAIPTGVGSKQGILLDDSGRGQAALNVIDANDGKHAMQPGMGQIVGLDGKPLSRAPEAGDLTQFGDDLAAAEQGLASARTAAATVGEMPQAEVARAFRHLGEEAAKRPNTGLAQAITELQSKLVNGEKGYITDVSQLNGVLKDVTTKLKSPDLATAGMDAGDAKYLGKLVNDLREGWGEKFAPLREANDVYKTVTDEVVNPMKKSVVGEIAGKRGALPDADAVKTKLTGVFDRGTVPGSKSSEILTLEKQFRGVKESENSLSGPAAYQDAVKSWMASKVSAASKQTGGRVDTGVAGELEKVFMGNDTKRQGFKDMLVGLARSQGKPDGTYVKGMERFMETVSRAARRPGSVQGISQQGAAEVAGRTIATTNGNTTVNPFRNLMLRWSERLQADAYKEMDRLLTSPEGVDMLQKLAKQPATSPAAQTAVATFLGTNAGQLDEAGLMQPTP
jgi:hypothetical protein